MSNLGEKVSYLKGLAEGMKLDTSSDEGKLIVQMIDVLSEAANQLDELQEAYQELNDYVECIDDDLEELELQCEGDDEDEGFEFDDDDEQDNLAFIDDLDDDEDDEDEEGDCEETDDCAMYVGCLCPECDGMFCVDAGNDCERLLICPHCAAKVAGVPMDFENVPMAKPVSEASEEPEDT
jgi:DNA-directed RNA polymerase subunit delta